MRRQVSGATPTPGSFAAGLSKAIEDSGLSLDRVQHRLALRDVHVSLSTLSYWRRGRSRPERAESLRAVRALEQVLSLPDDSLVSLLGPRRPRGRWVSRAASDAVEIEELWGCDGVELTDLLARLEPPDADRMTYLSVHDEQFVGADRQEARLRTRGVVRAEVDGVDRTLVTHRADPTDRAVARITGLSHCRLGRSRVDEDSGFLVAELIFDSVLRTGETAVFEFELTPSPAAASYCYDRRFTRPTPQYVLRVNFHANALPARCARFHRASPDFTETDERELWIGNSNSAHLVALDVPPGIVGMRWEWE